MEVQPFKLAPLVVPAIAISAGIAMADGLELGWPAMLSISLVGAVVYILLRHRTQWRQMGLIALAVASGGLHYYRYNHFLPGDHVRNYIAQVPEAMMRKVGVEAIQVSPAVIHQPEIKFPYHRQPGIKTRFLAQADAVTLLGRTYPAEGLIEVVLPGMYDQYRPGQRVRMIGKLTALTFSEEPFACFRANRRYKDGLVFARLTVSSDDDAIIVGRPGWSWRAVLARAQLWGEGLLLGNELPAGEHTYDLLRAVILGKQRYSENDLQKALVDIGAAHFLAVSGFNLAVLAGGIWAAGSFLGLSRLKTTWAVIIFTLLYGAMVDFQPSVTRATVMIFIFCIGFLMNRPVNALNSLAVAGLCILWVNPNQLFNIGFQLSFVATFGLIHLSRPIYLKIFPGPVAGQYPVSGEGRFIFRYLFDKAGLMFAASLAASAAVTPLVMYHFNLLSPAGPLASLVLYLPMSLLTLAGFAQLGVSVLVPSLGFLLNRLCDLFSSSIAAMSYLLAKLPGASIHVPAPAWYLVVGYLVVLLVTRFCRRRKLFHVLIAIYLYMVTYDRLTDRSWLYVRGETITVKGGSGLAMINCGSYSVGQTANRVRVLSSQYLTEPKFVVLSCPDERYFNDAWSLAEEFPDAVFFVPEGFAATADRYDPVCKLMQDKFLLKQEVKAGSVISLDDVSIRVLCPPVKAAGGSSAFECRIGRVKAVVCFQPTPYLCRLICRNYPDLRADILIVDEVSEVVELSKLVQQLGTSQIGLGGSVRSEVRRRLSLLADELNFQLVENSTGRGFLIELN